MQETDRPRVFRVAAVLTGVRPGDSGIYENGQDWLGALSGATSLPQHFARNGYKTLATGKIFHNGPDGHTTPGFWSQYQEFSTDHPGSNQSGAPRAMAAASMPKVPAPHIGSIRASRLGSHRASIRIWAARFSRSGASVRSSR